MSALYDELLEAIERFPRQGSLKPVVCDIERVDEHTRVKLTGQTVKGRISRGYGNRELLELLNEAVGRVQIL